MDSLNLQDSQYISERNSQSEIIGRGTIKCSMRKECDLLAAIPNSKRGSELGSLIGRRIGSQSFNTPQVVEEQVRRDSSSITGDRTYILLSHNNQALKNNLNGWEDSPPSVESVQRVGHGQKYPARSEENIFTHY